MRCNIYRQRNKGGGKFSPLCDPCHKMLHKDRKYAQYKKSKCEECGFNPVHPCQLDVDHIDGNHYNNDPLNLKTLCANCHRLKTMISMDWRVG